MELKDVTDTRTATDKALEIYAQEVFDWHNVAYRIFRAAVMGRRSARIVQEKPVDLSGTVAATVLLLRLEDLGYETSWEEVRKDSVLPRQDGSHEIIYCELAIGWHIRQFGDA